MPNHFAPSSHCLCLGNAVAAVLARQEGDMREIPEETSHQIIQEWKKILGDEGSPCSTPCQQHHSLKQDSGCKEELGELFLQFLFPRQNIQKYGYISCPAFPGLVCASEHFASLPSKGAHRSCGVAVG